MYPKYHFSFYVSFSLHNSFFLLYSLLFSILFAFDLPWIRQSFFPKSKDKENRAIGSVPLIESGAQQIQENTGMIQSGW
jgi:hypothetical protein